MSIVLPPCKTCLFWGSVERGGGKRRCHRFPPVPVGGLGMVTCEWPKTGEYDACGEHQQRSDD